MVLAHLHLDAEGLHLTAALADTLFKYLVNNRTPKVPVRPRWGHAGFLDSAADHLDCVSERETVNVLA